MERICVIGGGKWGQNHIKTLREMNNLAAIVDTNCSRLDNYKLLYPDVQCYDSLDDALSFGYDGYTLATPAETHHTIAKRLLSEGKSVLVEKPMTMTSEESLDLVETAKKSGAHLMVGHILLFHPAIRKIRQCIEEGKVGQLYYLYSNRLNLGVVRTKESVFSSLAPHDISVLEYLIGSPAIKIDAKGSKFLQKKVFDTTITMLEYAGGVNAHIFVSWLHPFKEQRLVVVGSDGMISFDDSSKEKEIHFYNKHIEFEDGLPIKVGHPDEIIPYEHKQPLQEELSYFVTHLHDEIKINTGEDGYQVVKVLEEVEKKLNM